jgi:hypothetical protein
MNRGAILGMLLACTTLTVVAAPAGTPQNSTKQDIKRDAKGAGKDIGHGAVAVGHATKHVAINIGHGAKEAGHGIAHGAREGWDATKHAFKHVFHKGE